MIQLFSHVGLNSSVGLEKIVSGKELNKAMNQLINSKNRLDQNDSTFEQELNESFNETTIHKSSLSQFDKKVELTLNEGQNAKETCVNHDNMLQIDQSNTEKNNVIKGIVLTRETNLKTKMSDTKKITRPK